MNHYQDGLRKIREANQRIKWATQKVTRGYSDPDAWNPDRAIAQYTGRLLAHLAENTHGYPYEYEGGPEAWKRDLKKAADALTNYSSTLYTVDVTEQDIKEAQRALRWVAYHLADLWD